jgi:fatty acid-binding protein DegV
MESFACSFGIVVDLVRSQKLTIADSRLSGIIQRVLVDDAAAWLGAGAAQAE